MTATEEIKALLPLMPDEVFNMYLVPLISDLGWSNNIISNTIIFNQTFPVFGEQSLNMLSRWRWSLHRLFLDEYSLHPDSNIEIKFIIMDHVENIPTLIRRNVEKSKERFIWHREFIKRTRSLCAPIVATKTTGIRILDGNHRLAALFALNLEEEVPVDAWLGE